MIKKTSSNKPCGRGSEYIIGAFLKSFSIESNSDVLQYGILKLLNLLKNR